MEHNIFLSYLMLAIVIVIFGLMIYQVIMQEDKSDQYYFTLKFSALSQDPSSGPPVYPLGNSGTLNEGIKLVRDSFRTLALTDPDLDFNIPHWSEWKINIVPVIDETDGSVANTYYQYTFPVSSKSTTKPEVLLNSVLGDSLTLSVLFSNTPDLAWAQTYFDDNVSSSLTYGTYGSGVATQSA